MSLSDKIKNIELDRSSGASQLARKALSVLRFYAQSSKKEKYRSFVEDFKEIGKRLLEAKPNMASVQNLVAQIVYEVDTLDEHDLVSVQKFAIQRIEELHKESELAVKKSAEWGASIIANSDILATCSYSSTVGETLKVAKQQGKSFKVFVAESRTEDNKFLYGQALAELLKAIKIPAEVFPDDEIYRYVPMTNYVLVGADSFFGDGSIINGAPTHEVALVANQNGLPFYAVCESIKANVLSRTGKNTELKEGFEFVPSGLITGIITEKGILDANEIVEITKEKSKFFESLIK
jgi:translation initiation factor eIF-2B subunit delta